MIVRCEVCPILIYIYIIISESITHKHDWQAKHVLKFCLGGHNCACECYISQQKCSPFTYMYIVVFSIMTIEQNGQIQQNVNIQSRHNYMYIYIESQLYIAQVKSLQKTLLGINYSLIPVQACKKVELSSKYIHQEGIAFLIAVASDIKTHDQYLVKTRHFTCEVLTRWLCKGCPGSSRFYSALLRASISHMYFSCTLNYISCKKYD